MTLVLRLGMGKLQQAIGETSASGGRMGAVNASNLVLQEASGLREKIQGEMNSMQKEMNELRQEYLNI